MLNTGAPTSDYMGGVGTPPSAGTPPGGGAGSNFFDHFFHSFGGGGAGGVGSGFSPYMHAGGTAIAQYLKSLQGMQDPTGYMAHIMGQYSQSPSAKLQTTQAIGAANQAAAQSGMLGAGSTQSAIARQAQGISQADQQQYLTNALGIQGQYLGGLGNISGLGEQAAGGQAQAKAQAAALAQQQQQFEEKQHSDAHAALWNNIIGGVGAAVGTAAHFL